MLYRINLIFFLTALLAFSCNSSGEQAGSAAVDDRDSLQEQEVTAAAQAIDPCNKLQAAQVREAFGLTEDTQLDQEADAEGAYCSYSWRPKNDLADTLRMVRLYVDGEASENHLREMSVSTDRTAYYDRPGEQGILFDPQFGHMMFVMDGYLFRLTLPDVLEETQQDNIGRALIEEMVQNWNN